MKLAIFSFVWHKNQQTANRSNDMHKLEGAQTRYQSDVSVNTVLCPPHAIPMRVAIAERGPDVRRLGKQSVDYQFR